VCAISHDLPSVRTRPPIHVKKLSGPEMLVTFPDWLIIPLPQCDPRPYKHPERHKKSPESPYNSNNPKVYARLRLWCGSDQCSRVL